MADGRGGSRTDAAARRRAEVRSSPELRLAAALHHLDLSRRVVEQRADIGVADMRLLWLLSDDRARTLREIADDLTLEQSTVNRQVNAALAAGLLRRDRDADQAVRDAVRSLEAAIRAAEDSPRA